MTALRLLVAMLAAGLVANAEAVRTPQQLYGPLYRAVEEAHLFLDSKEFADASPKASPDAIPEPRWGSREPKKKSHPCAFLLSNAEFARERRP
ncbi:hypothetical protein [Rhizomicrobium electricum]|uniref:hypothetical protein n=1 Tax=Rhizomicrobium electricum TaxID=480070 RepID=UPI0014205C84|nr:hypothetical protein [Rhizomicrobium electricum]NIJ47015.1 neutral trehalase [Rhizomicrobium electricum]